MSDLHEVIEDSISDAEIPAEDVVETEAPVEVEAAPEAEAPVEEAPATDEVPSPAAQTPAEKDEFEKKFGIPGTSASGRENRIPYSRVKKISEKAAADAVAAKVKEYEPKIAEYETKITDYEDRLGKVAEFEQVMVSDPDQFLQMLSGLPVYKPFFDKINSLLSGQTQQQVADVAEAPVTDDMPAPDQQLADGTMVYSMDGLKKLLAWQSNQAETRAIAKATKQIEDRYKPIEAEWQQHQAVQRIIPQVQQQIAEARTWPQFNENEAEIVQALQKDQKLSLEGAYRQVVFPKLQADRTKMREEILKEVQKAPRATSASAGAVKPSAQAPAGSGPRPLESVIEEAVKSLK